MVKYGQSLLLAQAAVVSLSDAEANQLDSAQEVGRVDPRSIHHDSSAQTGGLKINEDACTVYKMDKHEEGVVFAEQCADSQGG